MSALASAGTSMLLTLSVFLNSSASGVICSLELSRSGTLDFSKLSSGGGGTQVIWVHILGAGNPFHGQVEIGVTGYQAGIHWLYLSHLLSWLQ